jgi:hypothetical protein
MAGGLPTADEILAVVKEMIVRDGADAFRTDGRVQLYSGPRRTIAQALPATRRNGPRAAAQAVRSRSTAIEHTEVGRYLGSLDKSRSIYRYFDKHYAKRYGLGSGEAFREADRVMREASREFIRAAFGHVATAVCGAAFDRIFFEVELPAMVENRAIKSVNGIPTDLVREFYRLDPYEAFRLICLAELLEARRYAKAATPSKAKRQAKRDYRERLSFFRRERREAMPHTLATPADETLYRKLSKRRILARYNLMADMAAIVGDDPVPVPAPRRMARSIHAGMPHGAA